MMSDRTKGMTEAELAEYYDRTHDVSEFDESAEYPVEVRRNVTISVRFSEDEIEALRREAKTAGVKVTAYIRAAAVHASSPVDRKRLQEALRAVSEDVARVERLLAGKDIA
jgi:predicted DNA binding CopG/RHH family protein